MSKHNSGSDAAAGESVPKAPVPRGAADDGTVNPLNQKSYSAKYYSMREQRRGLPALGKREEFLGVMRNQQTVLLVGETGSGKTTQLPQFLLEAGYHVQGGERRSIACTQPRRVAAMSVSHVGYSVRFQDRTSPETILKSMTDGMLLHEAMTDPRMARYSVVILDEAHERTIHTDVLFGVVKGVMKERRGMKVVVMSATMDTQRMGSYFDGAPLVNITGRAFPVEIFYTREPERDYMETAIRTCVEIHNSKAPGDLLLFLPGEEEIEYACRALSKEAHRHAQSNPLIVRPLYAALPRAEQLKIYDPPHRQRLLEVT